MMVWASALVLALLLVLWGMWRRCRRRPLCVKVAATDRRLRVAVVGGGIAGGGAAWALRLSGIEVVLYEKRERAGGNANTQDFVLNDKRTVRVGLSVLAWPAQLFRHYEALLERLGVARQQVRLPFFVEEGKTVCLDQTAAAPLHPMFAGDLVRWKRMLWLINAGKALFAGRSRSLYAFSFFNPFNVIPLRLLSRAFGVSDRFWTRVVVPIYSTTFLTTNLNHIPSVIAPVMDEIIPLDDCPRLTTWSEGSAEVFDAMLQGVTIMADQTVVRVERDRNTIVVHSLNNSEQTMQREVFDRVIMACDAPSARAALGNSVGPMLRFVLGKITYADDCSGADFLQGWIHRDESVLSAAAKQRMSEMSNCVTVNSDESVVNTFVLSSWIPKVVAMGFEESEKPFLVTYGKVPIADPIQQIIFRFAHPMLCFGNLLASFVLRFVHTPSPIAFCGSWTTPGNGHDLSFCSGLAAAHAVGAAYPFADNAELVEEFDRVRSVLGQ